MKTVNELLEVIEAGGFSSAAGPLANRVEWQELISMLIFSHPDFHAYQVEDGWLETFTGERFYFFSPTADMVHMDDIVEGLCKIARFNGQTSKFYSVAEHSVLIAHYILKRTGDPRLAYTGLMHDAAEAYIGDMARPVKQTLPGFKEIEIGIDRVVSDRFGTTYPFPDIVKECDSRILVDERKQAMSDSGNDWGVDALEPLGVTIEFWSPGQARTAFRLLNDLLLTLIQAANDDRRTDG